jgi:activator of HSP90 ATPase
MRKAISAGASDDALLQPGMSTKSQAMVAMEESAAVAAVGERSQETAATKHSSSRTAATVCTSTLTRESGARGSSQGASTKNILATRVIARAAMNASNEHAGRRCNDSARIIAGGR